MSGRLRSLGVLLRQNRMLWAVTAGGAAVLVVGLLIGRFLVPASAGTARPEAGLATVPVAFGPLSNTVTVRGEAGYADPVDVVVDTAALAGPAVVTGRVPELDAQLSPLAVALEVSGRPVIVLPGTLPGYRTLQYGMSGPDVLQFKQAVLAAGIPVGDAADDTFDEAAAAAVTALYSAVGYSAPVADDTAADAVAESQERVQSAQLELTGAKHALAVAGAGPTPVALREADNAVASAQRALDSARAETPPVPAQIADLDDAVALAVLSRSQLAEAPDTTAERLAVDSATASLASATTALATAHQEALPTLPAGEILYLDQLPRRVDSVDVAVGALLEGPAMTVSGATLGLSGTIDAGDAALVQKGTAAAFDLPDGTTHSAVVAEIVPGADAESRPIVSFTPDPLTPEQAQQLAGTNVRVEIPVGATEGDVLSVPAAALTAGPGGRTRVEVVDGDPRDGERAATHRVDVETGLAAEGAVEVRPTGGALTAGDLVVVGR
jgi:multidrug efflux pump subunit AcrA (membrane-fusion protein)